MGRIAATIAVALGALALAAAGAGAWLLGSADAPSPAAAADRSGAQEAAGGRDASSPSAQGAAKRAKLTVIDSRFGRMLADRRGFALYMFTRDKRSGGKGKSRCYGACARAWPPLKTKRKPRVGKGLDPDLVGRTARRGGDKQVTYNGHPLYYYVSDRKPGQVLCQDVFQFGGRWLVVGKDGKPIR